eukprot:3704175-Pleurochrysis_carterae.AAC.2
MDGTQEQEKSASSARSGGWSCHKMRRPGEVAVGKRCGFVGRLKAGGLSCVSVRRLGERWRSFCTRSLRVGQGHPYVAGAGRQPAGPEIHTDPSTRVHPCLGEGGPWLDGEGAAPERENAHNAGLLADEELVGRCVRVGRSSGKIEVFFALESRMVPEADGGSAGDKRGSGDFHYRSDCPLGNAVELVNVRWAR